MDSACDSQPILIAKAPWSAVADVFIFAFWITQSQANALPGLIYSPLEAASEFSSPSLSRPVGGLGYIWLVQYKDTPVGPYDEMIIMPGKFEWSRQGHTGKPEGHQNLKTTRVYVSQKHTCYNGRLNWNVPKHLAKFDWETSPDGSRTVRVHPYDTTGDIRESSSDPRTFFQATIKKAAYTPSFPASSHWLQHLGVNLRCVNPPLPAGNGSQDELPGTDRWCSWPPSIVSSKADIVWFDVGQDRDAKAGNENFWPGLNRWRLGVRMENARLYFEPPVTW
ncbi:hypothetical protein CDD80_6763 [Ophiocordyceps camponoti-rufipedis]|uniref:Uncharacterized protein n=1 Tax=Ophiocordyceps camponoti-rufipedis TaxID=2004952 RepID=A0A2C5Z9E7_9HYPO|nr:hypothetical protein CDD80_6763 [Ophiocordyceps camponoti-rufipedis]